MAAVAVAPNVSDDFQQSRSEWIQSSFEGFRGEIDGHNDRRERLIKTSRDVTSLSKKLIFLLHRFPIPNNTDTSEIPARLLKDAQTKIDEIVVLLLKAGIEENLSRSHNSNQYRYEKNIGGGLEEFIEGVSFFHFLTKKELISIEQIEEYFVIDEKRKNQLEKVLKKDGDEENAQVVQIPNDFTLPIPTSRYLLGISDLTGELMRFATNSLSSTNNSNSDPVSVVKMVLNLLRDIYEALTPLTPFVQDLGKKQRVTAQSLQKCEDLMYQLNIRIGEFAQRVESTGGSQAEKDAVVREMMKRALQQGQSSSGPQAEDD
ncbi:unnamed protein product [Sympodiomycopsis kandeliae]